MLIIDISPMLWKLFLRSSVAWLIQLVTFYSSKSMLFFNLNKIALILLNCCQPIQLITSNFICSIQFIFSFKLRACSQRLCSFASLSWVFCLKALDLASKIKLCYFSAYTANAFASWLIDAMLSFNNFLFDLTARI